MHLPDSAAAVAVVVPVYNRLALLRETIDSLHAQTLADARFIIVDDGSNDEVRHFLRSLPVQDARFTILEKPEHASRGAQSSRNMGIDSANADAIVFLDSDDLLEPTCLEERLAFFRSGTADIVIGNQAVVTGDKLTWTNVARTGRPWIERFLSCSGTNDVPWINGGVLINATRLKAFGVRWREEFYWDDLLFHVECLAAGMTVAQMPVQREPDSYYRVHSGDRFGSLLGTEDGVRNVARMFVWLRMFLFGCGQLGEAGERALVRSFFHFCVRQPLELNNDSLAASVLASVRASGFVSARDSARIRAYIAASRVRHQSHRISSSLLKLAQSTWMKDFFSLPRTTFASMPVEGPVTDLISQLINDHNPRQPAAADPERKASHAD